jgi:hypothetical protein
MPDYGSRRVRHTHYFSRLQGLVWLTTWTFRTTIPSQMAGRYAESMASVMLSDEKGSGRVRSLLPEEGKTV